MFPRSSGVLMHVTSLPSPHGLGSLGQAAYDFIDFLADAGQTYWQVLPLGHVGFGYSPYQCYSAAAGNPFLIDLDLLAADGLLTADQVRQADFDCSPDHADYPTLEEKRLPVLRQAFAAVDDETQQKIDAFAHKESEWLPDYALFMAVRDHFDSKPIWEWDRDICERQPAAMKRYQTELAQEIAFYTFLQYEFFLQWEKVHVHAAEHNIQIIGDIPIYVSPDSSDVWAHPELFKVNKNRSPRRISGVPPDYFSETGQLWGNPVYDWKYHKETNYAWWIWRIGCNMELFDVVRIDHFRGLESYWEVKASAENAVTGVWRKGPGMALFDAMRKKLGDVPIIAEDLGIITDDVRQFLYESGYPGMRVLIFGFDAFGDNDHMPHNYPQNSIVYTSTHDSQTIAQQIMDICNESDRQFAYRYLRSSASEPLGQSAIKCVFASGARVAMTTMQDILSLGADARMNTPSTIDGNWSWRVRREAINSEVAAILREITQTYKR